MSPYPSLLVDARRFHWLRCQEGRSSSFAAIRQHNPSYANLLASLALVAAPYDGRLLLPLQLPQFRCRNLASLLLVAAPDSKLVRANA